MKTTTAASPRLLRFFALATAWAIASPTLSHAAESPEEKPKMGTKIMPGCEAMMGQKQLMKAEMKSQDTALATQVAAMNAAPTSTKADLMAAIVTRLVDQRTAHHTADTDVDEKMMAHMMAHMEMGKASMASCPMMKGMSEPSMGAHQPPAESKK